MPSELPNAQDASLAALGAACDVVGDRWSLPVIGALLDGPLRYGELQARLPAIAPNILTARLRKLEGDGLVVSSRYSARPPRFEYRVTADGAGLADVTRVLASWSSRRAGAEHEQLVHDACGSAIEVRWWCPTCEVAAAPNTGAPVFV
ncbi:MAG TPA: helix-turn-helix domain-containing protein [Solirubrobacteraceae bacterium]|nr:helix-turn-helix domain-containing protein [Solirubrobacteraceae bacterium]